jgi:hypothetical protein
MPRFAPEVSVKVDPAIIDRFLSRVDMPSSFVACWPWTARIDRYGYGCAYLPRPGRHGGIGAHRLSYVLAFGSEPEAGLEIDHLCRVRRCVNPLHLEAVSKKVNSHRGQSIQAHNARKTHCDRSHEFTPDNTRVTANGYRVCRKCECIRASKYKAKKRAERALVVTP